MSYRIISDSSSNRLFSDDPHYTSVAMHITIDGHDWTDDPDNDVDRMTEVLYASEGKSSTSCPGPGQWLEAFDDAQHVFCITITHTLSGSYNSAMTAKQQYEEQHPDRHVYVIDSLATGPRMLLLIDYLEDLLKQGTDFAEAYEKTIQYRDSTDLIFIMESVKNFVSNGRMNALLAKTIGMLGIRFIGTASEEGKLKLLAKTRGAGKTLSYAVSYLERCCYQGGRIIIAHHQNIAAAHQLKSMLLEKFGNVLIEVQKTTALCSYYAERGGLLIGFEKPPLASPGAGGVRETVKSLARTVGSLRKSST